MEKIDFIEAEAKANAAFHLACSDALEKQANMFVTLMLAGAGAALGYSINLSDKSAPLWQVSGIGAVSLYLFALAAITTWRCLWSREMYPPANEPKNLDQESILIDVLRNKDLQNKQKCIDLNRDRNDLVGLWLNRCRLMAAATPIIFALSALAFCF